MQQSAVSIPCNIAEGYARISQKEKVQLYSISRGSVAELQTQLLVTRCFCPMPFRESQAVLCLTHLPA
ncbi:four helix bundle protein [Candidatus Saccharibacteria bacterium]|nr:MAG: four helix bundle protein [Candidatus Saccharibacteria bacterium]